MARITLQDIRHAYGPDPQREEDWALKKLTLELKDGGAYALLGPSGCGKTTLLNLISGLLAPTEAASCSTAPTSRMLPLSSATSPRCSSFRSSTTR